mgnify:CR=1 FL=1
MFTGLVQWITGRNATTVGGAYDHAFVQDVRVQQRPKPDPKVVRFIFICWVLIAVKHALVIWAVWHYRMPFHQLIVNFPTWLFGVIATTAYYRRTAAS